LAGVGDVLRVAVVGLDGGQEPVDGLLIVLVLLALDDDLLQAVDILVAALLGELVTEEVPGLVDLLVGAVLVLLGDTLADAHEFLAEALKQE
jgi:hypothetical protein